MIPHENELLQEHALIITDKKISAIIPEQMIRHHLPAQHYHFPAKFIVTPGLIDLHIHGANGFDVMDGSKEAIQEIATALAKEGVTGFLATTMSADKDRINNVLKNLASFDSEMGAQLLGIHLEGPFISPKKAGAQLSNVLLAPDLNLFKEWQKAAKNRIKLVTIAPELPDAIAFIRSLKQLGVIVSIGHTDATFDETKNGIQAGATHASHLFNAMRGIHQREPGATGAILLSDEVTAEIIVDGIHLHPSIVNLIYKLKIHKQLVLISDAIRAKCLGDGIYDLGGQQVEVKGERAQLSDGTLAGSILRLPNAIQNVITFTHCKMIDAINMASLNPARILELEHKGSIDNGKDADIAVFDDNWNTIVTFREGQIIYQHDNLSTFIAS